MSGWFTVPKPEPTHPQRGAHRRVLPGDAGV